MKNTSEYYTMRNFYFFTLLLLSLTVTAQKKPAANPYVKIDEKTLAIPEASTKSTNELVAYIKTTFDTLDDCTRAAFIWVASTIEYDVENMFALNPYESKEVKIAKVLATHKGICEHYAVLLNDIFTKLEIQSYVIEGYVKQGEHIDFIPHAWCMASIGGDWYAFDPTWAAGYINNRKFYPQINNSYYKVKPSDIVKTHLPFDYLWQFVDYPVTCKEFEIGQIEQNPSKPYFNYTDTLKLYESQAKAEQLQSAIYRIEKNGIINTLTFNRLQLLKTEFENLRIETENKRQNAIVDILNSASVDYNESVNLLNNYVNYWNKQFTPMRPDAEIQSMLNEVMAKISESKSKLRNIERPPSSLLNNMIELSKRLDEIESNLNEKQAWLNQYFSKSKSARKKMFYSNTKITWFGIPLN